MSGRGISQNVDASESFVDGRNSGLLETIGAYQSGCMIYGRLHIWETPTKGEEGLGTNRFPGTEPATYSNSPSNALRACRVAMASGLEWRSSPPPGTRWSQAHAMDPTR